MEAGSENRIDRYSGRMLTIVSMAYIAFQLFTAGYRPMQGVRQMVVHLGFALVVTCLQFIRREGSHKNLRAVLYTVLLIAAICGTAYSFSMIDLVQGKYAGKTTPFNIFAGLIMILVVLVLTQRKVGNGLPVLVVVFMAYAFWGNRLPPPFGHKGYSISKIVTNIFYGTGGMWGSVLQASSTLISMFMIFGAVLELIHGGEFIAEFSQALLGNVRGGPAKVSVIGSGLMGSISGSVSANVVGTGSITIPLMKKIGFTPEFAAAVEAVASTGGQLMPPVMGAAAFLMADYVGVSYRTIVMAALVPALLYYFHVFVQVDYEAKRQNLKPLSKEDIPDLKATLRWGAHVFIPIIAIFYFLIFVGGSVTRSAFLGTVIGVAASFLNGRTRINPKRIPEVCVSCAKSIALVAVSCASAGLIVGIISLTGLGFKLSNMLVILSGGNTVILLLLTMVASIILGMGLPTTAAYIILASLVAPALTEQGVPVLAAHFFIFYFGIYANITPPVAVGLYAAIGIAETNRVWKTAANAMGLCLTGFIMPFLIVFREGLFLQGGMYVIFRDVFVTAAAIVILNIAQGGSAGKVAIPLLARLLLLVLCFFSLSPIGGDIVDFGCCITGALICAGFAVKGWKSQET